MEEVTIVGGLNTGFRGVDSPNTQRKARKPSTTARVR